MLQCIAKLSLLLGLIFISCGTSFKSSRAIRSGMKSFARGFGQVARSGRSIRRDAHTGHSAPSEGLASKGRGRILSGIQPTGSLHIGNYLGAVKQWVDLQHQHDSFFCVVDLHAVTQPHNPAKLGQETLQAAATYLAAGIDPKVSRIFVQSSVPAHAELAWLLNCITPISWLERMTQYKEKAAKNGANACMGLFDYPVLMAADILLYQTNLVPVGDDQLQHLELTRDIRRKFHDQFCSRQPTLFQEPRAMVVKEGARIMSLLDGRAKMSKSDPNDASRINLLDPPEVIQKKIKRCKTDALVGLEWDNPDRPEAANLLNLLQAVTGQSRAQIQATVSEMNWGTFKPLLADSVIAHLSPIQRRYAEIMQDRTYLESVLEEGRQAANGIATQTLKQVKTAMGYLQ